MTNTQCLLFPDVILCSLTETVCMGLGLSSLAREVGGRVICIFLPHQHQLHETNVRAKYPSGDRLLQVVRALAEV